MNPQHPLNTPRLLGNIGCINAGFALVQGEQPRISHKVTLPARQFSDLTAGA